MRKYVPFALGGVLFALVLNAGIPRPRATETRVAPPRVVAVNPAPVPAELPKPDVVDEASDAEPIEQPQPASTRSAEWHERHGLTPRTLVPHERKRGDYTAVHEPGATMPKSPRR